MQKQRTPYESNRFRLTQQLGFKAVLHCWCGATFDFNINRRPKTAKAFMADHEDCTMPANVPK